MVASADPRTGEAVVAGQVGKAQARIFSGPVHEGRTELVDLTEGDSVGETSTMLTGRDGRLCVLLTPGALLCVAPETQFKFTQLRVAASGLPETEDDLVRRIHIELHKGRILLHAGPPSPSRDIRIQLDAGVVEASGGTFVVASLGGGQWAVVSESHELTLVPKNGARSVLSSGRSARLGLQPDGQGEVVVDASLLDMPERKFELCNSLFEDLDPFIQDPIRFDRQGFSDYLGLGQPITFLGYAGGVTDVSPSYRPVVGPLANRRHPAGEGMEAGGRWDPKRIWAWYEAVGVIKGVNYIPRNAVNSTAMWMKDVFDADLIDEELGWAQRTGYTSVRVQLQYCVWESDPKGFLDRMEQFLDLAGRHSLKVVPVLFDDLNLAGEDPQVGPPPEPIPGQHNARWTPSPGATLVKDRAAWGGLERYTKDVIGKFKRDDRILYWDLYNSAGSGDMWEASLPLMDATFRWARKVDPKQPLAVAAWRRYGSAMSERIWERSDLITFQSFEDATQVEALIQLLLRFDRPMICADWLMRQQGSQFQTMLPLFAKHRIGWFNRGFANGKTQMWIQQKRATSESDPDLWQHDVLKADGSAYEPREIEMIQSFRF